MSTDPSGKPEEPVPPTDNDRDAWERYEKAHAEWHLWEFTNWENILQRVDRTEGLEPDQRDAVKDALGFLRSELGEGYLRRLVTAGAHVEFVFNLAPWPLLSAIEFADSVRLATKMEGYSSLRRRLRDGEKVAEGTSVLALAAAFGRRGHRVRLDPVVLVDGREKKPDIGLEPLEGGSLEYVEVSRLGPSEAQLQSSRTTNMALMAMHVGEVLAAGQFSGPLHPDEEEAAMEQLRAAMHRVKEAGTWEVLDLEGRAEIAVAALSRTAEIEAWACEHGYHFGIGTSVPDDAARRLTAKLYKEQEQLPPEGHGLICLSAHGSALLFPDWQALAQVLEGELRRYQHVAGVVVSDAFLHPNGDTARQLGRHRLITRVRAQLVQERSLLVVAEGAGEHWLIEAAAKALSGGPGR